MKKSEYLPIVQGWTGSSGKTMMLRYLNGEHICASQAIKAKCADCGAGFHDGRKDCGIESCPCYPWMPYRKGQSLPVDDTYDESGDMLDGLEGKEATHASDPGTVSSHG